MNELLGIPFSPWSEKARWALDVRAVPYRYRIYQPLLGEPELRLKTRRWRGTVSVPIMTDAQGKVYDDSAKIARFAAAHGQGPELFPAQHEAAIAHWIELSERALSAGRALSLQRQLEDDEALAEMVPRKLRRMLGSWAARVGEAGIRRTLRKYDGPARSNAEHARDLRGALDELRASLDGSRASPKTLLGGFSFADIAAAQILAFVSPPTFGLKLGKASRRGFTYHELALQYADLIAWRDALYETHRPKV